MGETTAGNAVAATIIWDGTGMMKDDQARQFPGDNVGLMAKTGRTYISKEGVTITLEDTPLTSEQLPYLLAMGVESVVAGVADSTGSGYVYQYDFPITTPNASPKTYTVEGGDNQEVGEAEYCYAEEITLKFAAGDDVPWAMGATLKGRQWTDAELTALSGTATLHYLTTAKLYIDTTLASIGTTQKTSTFLGAELTIPTNWKAVPTGDGAITYTFLKNVGHKDNPVTGTLTLEHDTTGEAELNAARAGTLRYARIVGEGAALTTAGVYSKHSVVIDGIVQYTDVSDLSDDDGDSTVALPFEWRATTTFAGQIKVVNELTTLP